MIEGLEKMKDEKILAISLKNPSFFGVLVDRYQEAFLRAASKIVNHREESQDIVQEAFVKIYKNGDRFKEQEGGSFKSWAYKIVINTALTHYRKLKLIQKSVEYFDSAFYDISADDESFFNADMKILVARTLQEMPKQLQRVLAKYYLEDKSQKDIASEENISVTAVKMRLFRAKKIFKKIIEEDKKICL
ncbi:sigma-70 family RNA polymerase sigma factor, partial [Patescibacteria group bacterium]|nr:sigma-70 family RNA polymerase sigma factor [Patescibacteria group bacterium]